MVLITGGTGQLGKELKGILGEKALALSHKGLDITNFSEVETSFQKLSPSVVVNCAAYTNVEKAEEDATCFTVNRDGTKNLAKACKSRNIPFVHVSTDYVFDGGKSGTYSEDDPTNPLNAYGESKLEGEKSALEIYPENTYVVRTSWLYSSDGKNFVTKMIDLMSERDEISVVNDQFGAPTWTKDLASFISKLMEIWPKSGIYHFSNSGTISWYDFAVEIRNIKNIECKITPVTSDKFPQKARRPKYSSLNLEKAAKLVVLSDWKDSLKQSLGN